MGCCFLVPLERNYLMFLSIFDFSDFSKMVPLLIALALLIMISAFFSSMETAYSSVNIIRLRNYLEEKKKGAKKAVYIAEKYDLTLTTILVGNNLVNIGATTIGAYVLARTIINPTIANIANTIIMTLIILIFGEILPKSYGKEHSEKVALNYSSILYFVIKILYPITWVFIKLKKVIIKRNEDLIPYVTEDELESIIYFMEYEGVIENYDAELIQSAISLNEINVFEIMTPRVDVVAIEINEPIEDIKNMFFEYQFSRVPVYEDDKDNMIGVLSERDFFTAYIKNNGKNINIKKLISKPFYVSKTKKVDDLIREMQQMKKHFAIVADEYGGTSGIVTMEDALEELVGEIYDEYDEYIEEDDAEKFVEIAPNKYLISADMDIEFLFEQLKLGREPDTKFTNIGGFVYELSEEMPTPGKQVKINTIYEEDDIVNPIHHEYEVIFTVEKVQSRRIKTIIVEVNLIEEAA